MAQNTALKYSSKVDERFKLKELTGNGLNTDYDWNDVDEIKVYSINTVPLNDYVKSGSSRYGTPAELDDTVKSYKLTTDKAFTFTIDRFFKDSQMKAKATGKALAREIDEEAVPFKDKQRLLVWTTTAIANSNFLTATLSKTNTYEKLLAMQATLDEKKIPLVNRIFYVTPGVANFLKLDSSFVKSGDLSQKMLVKNQVGEVDGVPVVKIPSTYFPQGVDALLVYTKSTMSPQKLRDYITHHNPVGINGDLVEGRFMIDTFVLENKKNGIVGIGASVPLYFVTMDSVYKTGVDYYTESSGTYTKLVAGTDYTVGDAITGTVYEKY